jgi:DNA-binding transcriptional regulator PaaX
VFYAQVMCKLDYNQLKRLLLRTLANIGPTSSDSLVTRLNSEEDGRFEIHAVRMALVRYYRQGLLKRVRSGGEFQYSLSARGTARLQWLEDTARTEDE